MKESMGEQAEKTPPEVTKFVLSNERYLRSPRGPGGAYRFDRFDSPRASLTKYSTDSPRLSSAFSSSSLNNISPSDSKHARSVSKKLDFSSPGSVSSKTSFQISPRGVASRSSSAHSGLGNSESFSPNGHAGAFVAEDTKESISGDEIRQIEQVLLSSGGRLEELYKQVSGNAIKDHGAVFESLQWDILRETSYMSWFGLAFTLAGFLRSQCKEEVRRAEGNQWAALKSKADLIIDQLDELKPCLAFNSDIYKLAAGTLLYCCAVVRHLELGPDKCSCFRSPSRSTFKQQLESTMRELKSLQDNLNFATLAAVGNPDVRQPKSSLGGVMKRCVPEQPSTIIGLEPHIDHITKFIKKKGVCLVGIHGQSGLGKTTLLNEIVSKVETSEKRLFAYIELTDPDLRRLQSSLIQQLGGEKKEFSSTTQGRSAILYQVQKLKQQNKVVRIAIDNLSDVRLMGELFPHSLGKVLPTNSCVIVTCSSATILSKMDQLCRTAMPDYHYLPYKLPPMASQQAKSLFLSHAAPQPVNILYSNGVLSKCEDLADHFLPLCEGLPMAIKVVGSYFSNPANQSKENWTAVGNRMKQVAEEMETSEDKLFAKLMVICEQLGRAQKEAFLDIAAFFRGWDWRILERIVGKPQLDIIVDQGLAHPALKDTDSFSGIGQLTRYSEQPWRTEMVVMHDLLYAIASRRAQGNRVHSEDQTHLPDRLLLDSFGMELTQIQGLSLISCKEALQGTMLERMMSLRMLLLQDTSIKGYCTKTLHQLRFFYWGKSQIARDVRIPFQMSRLRKLEMVILRASEIDLAMKFPSQLKDLTIVGCTNMEELPETILVLTSLLELHLINCNKLQDLTFALGSLKSLHRFRMENCNSIRQLPKTIGQLTSLSELDLSGCTNLTTLPTEIGTLVGLNKLNITRCKCLIRIPPEIGLLKNVKDFLLGQSGVTTLPSEIGQLNFLETLSLSGCARLEKLPKEIGQLVSLLQLNLGSCTSLKELPREIGKLASLQKLSLNGCSSLARLPEGVFELVNLQALDLDQCKLLAHLSSDIRNLRSLQRLSLNFCTRLNRLPVEIARLPSLQVLNLVGCTGLKPELSKEIQRIMNQKI